ncbi:MAG: FAD-dependent oxidoreductase, partial [Gemmatimonadaceae bacterium]
LEHGQVGMVRESVREREVLMRIAPHLVKPLEFTWPVYRGARLPKWKLRAGLTLYDWLAGKTGKRRHHSLDRDAVLAAEPCLRSDHLIGGASYFDSATNDAALTRANVADAVARGSLAVEFAKVESTICCDAKCKAQVTDLVDGGSATVSAKVIVSATGPWQARGTKGSHIVIEQRRIGNEGAVTMISPDDGRVMFTLPDGERTIIGTTDLRTDETPDNVVASEPEIQYLLRAANFYFPGAGLVRDDVVETWAGIRPLAAAPPGSDPSSISREHRISRHPSGIIVVTGGKLTTYRSMAAEVVDTVESALGLTPGRAPTDLEILPG